MVTPTSRAAPFFDCRFFMFHLKAIVSLIARSSRTAEGGRGTPWRTHLPLLIPTLFSILAV